MSTTTGDPEEPAPYGPGPTTTTPAATPEAAATETKTPKRIRIPYLQQLKDHGEPWPMLTAYDMYTAQLFDQAGIPVLLVGDSAANNVYGYDTSLPVTIDELLPLVRAVTRSVTRALVIADFPFGSYQLSPEQALATGIRFMKEGLAHAVKLEGGHRFAPHVEALTTAGIPVMGHIGFTPQSEHNLGGYRVQGRGEQGDLIVHDALALQQAGAFAIVMEMIPAEVAKRVTHELHIPTVGIGAGPDCDAQVLVWQDMTGLRRGKTPRFVKRYADLATIIANAATQFADDVRTREFPAPEHAFH